MDEITRQAKEKELAALLELFDEQIKYNQAWLYNPGRKFAPTEKQMEFHATGGLPGVRFRTLGAGNQQGKTFAGAMEVYFHLSGRYPEWWTGKRFDGPIFAWISGVTNESTRDNPQRTLLGEKRYWGTGVIPKKDLAGEPTMARGGIPDAVDSFEVKHVSGGTSFAWFKSYKEGREKWQGRTLDLIWYDEEPPMDIWSEGKARLMRRNGIAIMTFTPLLGMTEVVRLFYEPDKNPDRDQYRLVLMGIDDATFYSPEERAQKVKEWPEHEKRARLHGLPILGEGLVYPIHDGMILTEPFELPNYFRRIVGLDVGVSHPTAAVFLAHNPDTDVVYLYGEYKKEDPLVSTHASALTMMGADRIPVAWPHDALKANPQSGLNFADLYRKYKLNMLPFSARLQDDKGGVQPYEVVIAEILQRMQDGRFKVFPSLREWFREKQGWHRKDGKPVDYMDDLMKATIYGMMMLRHARPLTPRVAQVVADDSYNPLGADWYG